ncbi:hypothetical protein [Sphingomonas sp.]|uniref:ExbD/TolR family protein n=1 Tax=Sphingomonas sp. TaxID=28214 RepID=UPI001B13ADF3|nr:hypothetical protein [Sphingomonas sp.]MBO9713125.1 hypothetical protein [Sphingomonas sp.]
MVITAALLALALQGTPPMVRIELSPDCVARIDGQPLDDAEIVARARHWQADHRWIGLIGSVDTPYKCVGGLISRIQRAGFTGSIGFIAEPGPPGIVHLNIPSGRCAVEVNGKRTDLDEFAATAKTWSGTQPEIHLQASPEASFRCVDRVLNVLRESHLQRLGFVGNEQYVATGPEEPKP